MYLDDEVCIYQFKNPVNVNRIVKLESYGFGFVTGCIVGVESSFHLDMNENVLFELTKFLPSNNPKFAYDMARSVPFMTKLAFSNTVRTWEPKDDLEKHRTERFATFFFEYAQKVGLPLAYQFEYAKKVDLQRDYQRFGYSNFPDVESDSEGSDDNADSSSTASSYTAAVYDRSNSDGSRRSNAVRELSRFAREYEINIILDGVRAIDFWKHGGHETLVFVSVGDSFEFCKFRSTVKFLDSVVLCDVVDGHLVLRRFTDVESDLMEDEPVVTTTLITYGDIILCMNQDAVEKLREHEHASGTLMDLKNYAPGITIPELVDLVAEFRSVVGGRDVRGTSLAHLLSVKLPIGKYYKTIQNWEDEVEATRSDLETDRVGTVSNAVTSNSMRINGIPGLHEGPFIEYDMNSMFPYIFQQEFPYYSNMIDRCFERRLTCKYPMLWKLATNCTITRTLGKGTLRDFMNVCSARLATLGDQEIGLPNIYLSVVDSFCVREGTATGNLRIGINMGEFKLKDVVHPWVLVHYDDFNQRGQSEVVVKYSYLQNPVWTTGYVMDDDMVIIVYDRDLDLYVIAKYQKTFALQAPRMTADQERIVDDLIQQYLTNKPYRVTNFGHVLVPFASDGLNLRYMNLLFNTIKPLSE